MISLGLSSLRSKIKANAFVIRGKVSFRPTTDAIFLVLLDQVFYLLDWKQGDSKTLEMKTQVILES